MFRRLQWPRHNSIRRIASPFKRRPGFSEREKFQSKTKTEIHVAIELRCGACVVDPNFSYTSDGFFYLFNIPYNERKKLTELAGHFLIYVHDLRGKPVSLTLWSIPIFWSESLWWAFGQITILPLWTILHLSTGLWNLRISYLSDYELGKNLSSKS